MPPAVHGAGPGRSIGVGFGSNKRGTKREDRRYVMTHATGTMLTAILLGCSAAAVGGAKDLDPLRQWGQWRGPLATGVAPHGHPPVEWSETKNVRWKIAIPGKGHSTPIIWEEQVFLTTAVPDGEVLPPRTSDAPGAHDILPVMRRQKFVVLAVNRRDGTILWQRDVVTELPHEGHHVTASFASPSPVTDGEHLFAFFGSEGLYALDLEGNVLWQKDFGRLRTLHAHGAGSSPTLHRDTLIINWDHEGDSFLAAFEKRTGRQRWNVRRDVRSTSWTTPIVVEKSDRPQVIVSGSQRVRAYDLATGEPIWECGGLSVENVVASPVAGDDLVFAGSSYDRPALLAIRFRNAAGDITGTDKVVWQRRQGPPYVPSPLLYGDALYYVAHFRGVLTRVDARTGKDRPGLFRLDGVRDVFASPVGAAGRVYIPSRNGTTVVMQAGPELKILARNHLDDSFSASPAVVGNELYLRGEQYLYCLARRQGQ